MLENPATVLLKSWPVTINTHPHTRTPAPCVVLTGISAPPPPIIPVHFFLPDDACCRKRREVLNFCCSSGHLWGFCHLIQIEQHQPYRESHLQNPSTVSYRGRERDKGSSLKKVKHNSEVKHESRTKQWLGRRWIDFSKPVFCWEVFFFILFFIVMVDYSFPWHNPASIMMDDGTFSTIQPKFLISIWKRDGWRLCRRQHSLKMKQGSNTGLLSDLFKLFKA